MVTDRMILDVGEHDIPDSAYHADPCPEPGLSAGLAHLMVSKTPLHAWTKSQRLNPFFEPENKTQFDVGAAFHEIMTGKGKGIWHVEFDDYKKKAAQEERDKARAEGYTPLTTPQLDQVRTMQECANYWLQEHGIGDVFDRGDCERTLIWKRDGIYCRALVDCIDRENRVFYDLKSAANVDPEGWVRNDLSHGTDIRAAHYLDGADAIFGEGWRYRFILTEKEPPHCLSVVELSPDALFIGTKKIRRARTMWRTCLTKQKWPAYPAEIVQVQPPPYVERDWLEREVFESTYRQQHGKDVLEAMMAFQAPPGWTPPNRKEDA